MSMSPVSTVLRGGQGVWQRLDLMSMIAPLCADGIEDRGTAAPAPTMPRPHIAGGRGAPRRDAAFALTLPFADLLAEGDSAPARTTGPFGRIERQLVDAFIALVERQPSPVLSAALERFAALPPDATHAAEDAALAAVWHAAAAMLDKAIRGGAVEFADIAACLHVGSDIQALRRSLPFNPVLELRAQHIRFIVEACERARSRDARTAAALLHAVAVRLSFPEEMARVVRALYAREGGRTRWEPIGASLLDRVVDAMEAAVIEATDTEDAPDEEGRIIAAARVVVRIVHGLSATVGLPKTEEAGRRIAALRATIADRLNVTVLDDADTILADGFTGGWRDPGMLEPAWFTEVAASGAVARAERRAAAIAEIRLLAEELAVSGRIRSILSNFEKSADRYGDRLLETIDRAADPAAWRAPVMSLVHMMELLLGSERADRFRRRAFARMRRP